MKDYIAEIKDLVLEGEDEEIVALIDEALAEGVPAKEIVSRGLIEGMNEVGPLMASGELYVPEVLLCAETMQLGLNHLKPQLKAGDVTTLGKIVIGTVEGDLHDIGKDLVAMMLESSGFEVVNLGIDQPVEHFLEAGKDADIVAISALLTTTMPAMRETVKLLKESNTGAKVIIGGAPVSDEFAEEIGADGYAEDAGAAVVFCKELLSA
ncbi:MAG: corrinoid protein [Eubacterium sp.]